jgi:GT2 family glycosyltransferase
LPQEYAHPFWRNAVPYPSVSIVIPVFNQIAYTQECVQALKDTFDPNIHTEIILVDNGSTDATPQFLKKLIQEEKKFRMLRSPNNLGFSPACNWGAQEAKGEVLVFLNNDTLPQTDWLAPLLEELSAPEVGIVGPKLLNSDGLTINHAGYIFQPDLHTFLAIYYGTSKDFYGVNKRRNMSALLGACVAIRRELFFDIGSFPLYGLEDIDICLKLKERGKKVMYTPLSTVIHHGSVTFKNSPPDTIPAMGQIEFATLWSSEVLQKYTVDFFELDGLSATFSPTGTPSYVDHVRDSISFLENSEKMFAAGKDKEGEAELVQALQLYPHNTQALLTLTDYYLRLHRMLDAAETLLKLADTTAWNAEYLLDAAQIFLAIGKKDRAQKALENILRYHYPSSELLKSAQELLLRITES